MPAFKSGGREWLLAIDAPKVLAVRRECDVNLAIGSGIAFDIKALTQDPVVLPGVLWVLCRKQAEAAGITQDQFLEAIVGDITEDAGLALAEAIVDFIPSRSRREALREWVSQERVAQEAATALTRERLGEVSSQMTTTILAGVNQVIDKQLTLLRSATDSPEPADAGPMDLLGASSNG